MVRLRPHGIEAAFNLPAEIFFAGAMVSGFAVRLVGASGIVTLNLLVGLYNHPTEWVRTYVGIICAHRMFAVTGAGQSLGLDHLLCRPRALAPAWRLARLYRLAV